MSQVIVWAVWNKRGFLSFMRTNALSYPPFHSDREGEHLTTNHENKYIIMDCDIIFLKKLVAKLAKNELKK